MQFEWDVANENEVLKHGVAPAEAEEAFEDARMLLATHISEQASIAKRSLPQRTPVAS